MDALDYRRLFEEAPVPVVVLDRELRVVAVNDAYLGATLTTREALVGRPLFDALPTDPAQRKAQAPVRKLLERVLQERKPQRLALHRYDVPRPPEQGGGYERRYWNADFAPIFAADGEVAHIRCIVEEVTDRARDARLRQLWGVEGVGVVFFDREGTLISANDTFLHWTGYTPEEVAAGGLTWRTLTPPEYVDLSLEQQARLASTGHIGPYEKEYCSKDGTRRWMLSVGGQLDDGTIAELVLDVSDRKAAERGQREMEERYRSLFSSIDAGFCVFDMIYDAEGRPRDYRFVEVNPAFERQTDLRDAAGRTIRELAPGHEQHWFDTYGRIIETGESLRFVQEARALRRWYEVFAFRMGGEGDQRIGALFYDITERVLAQQAVQDEARRKDEFMATLAHELRNPLAPIRNAVSLLKLRPDTDAQLTMIGGLIDRQVTQLSRLVDDLLDASRIRFGKVQLQRAVMDLREAVHDAVATSEPLVAAGRHRLDLDLGTEPVWVDADRVRLAQVVSNLLNNAARYTPPGGSLRIEITRGDTEAGLAVEDNGIGIDPAQLERVFEPFAQLEARGGPASGGIGIGLALARALVDLHDGRISAQSAGPGKGSRFVLCLPRASAPKAAAASVAVAARKPPRRLLLVDDNVDAATSQAAVLRILGHQVEVAHDGMAALQMAEAFRPEIVLLDLGMPGMDGFEVARRLRASQVGQEIKLVAQTGWSQDEDRRRTREAGFDAHLAKPVDMAALQQLL